MHSFLINKGAKVMQSSTPAHVWCASFKLALRNMSRDMDVA
jgi:hypothetical protein